MFVQICPIVKDLAALRALAIRVLSGEYSSRESHDLDLGAACVHARVHLTDTAHCTHCVVLVIEKTSAGLPNPEELVQRFRLTPREAEVALLLCQRYSSKEIARIKSFTRHTAHRHTERVLAKLGISSRKHVLDAILQTPPSHNSIASYREQNGSFLCSR